MLEKGAKVNRKSKDGETVLYVASREGYSEMIRLLMKHGANVNTPLQAATKNVHLDVVRKLLENNSKPNFRKPDIGSDIALNINDTRFYTRLALIGM